MENTWENAVIFVLVIVFTVLIVVVGILITGLVYQMIMCRQYTLQDLFTMPIVCLRG